MQSLIASRRSHLVNLNCKLRPTRHSPLPLALRVSSTDTASHSLSSIPTPSHLHLLRDHFFARTRLFFLRLSNRGLSMPDEPLPPHFRWPSTQSGTRCRIWRLQCR